MIQPAVLIYDGDCRFCQGGMRWIESRARRGMFEYLPCQSDERRNRFPEMAEATCMEAMQVALPDGRILNGAEAIPEILKRLRGWRWLAGLFRLPGMGFIAPHVYAWVARHRYTISCMLPHREERTRSTGLP